MKHIDLSNVQAAGENKGLPAGGYICRYTNVEDSPEKEYLFMEFDIDEGEHKGYYKKLEERAGFWGGRCFRSYKVKAQPMFKRMCNAVTRSNPGYIFDGGDMNADEKTLVGKQVGIVLGEEEYEKNNGSVGTRLYVAYECNVDDIRAGKFKVPDKKVLPQTAKKAVSDDFMKVNGNAENPFV